VGKKGIGAKPGTIMQSHVNHMYEKSSRCFYSVIGIADAGSTPAASTSFPLKNTIISNKSIF